MKILRRWFLAMLVTVLVFACPNLAKAEDTVSDNSTQPVKMKTVRVKEKLSILKGDKRVLFTNLPYGTTVTSSNTRILQVANSGMARGRKVGTAKVTVVQDNVKRIYTVEVKDTVDLILFAGQSNMYGTGGYYSLAPKVPIGVGYEYDTTTKTKRLLHMTEPFGRGNAKEDWAMSGNGYSNQGTLVSAFCINYYKQTKTPVVGIFEAWGALSTQKWLEERWMKESVSRIREAKKYLKKKKINVRHIYVVWYQGESDAMFGVEPDAYIKNMKAIQKNYKKVGVEQMMIIRIGSNKYDANQTKAIAATQVKLCQKDKNFTLVSKVAASLATSSKNYHSDALHLNQYGLNKVGYEAGTSAGKYAKKHKKK